MGRVFKPTRRLADGRRWRSKKWWIELLDESGRRRAESISTDKRVAASKLRKEEERVERIRLGLEVAGPGDPALAELATRFLEDMALHLRGKTLKAYRGSLEYLVLGKEKPKRQPEIRVRKVSELSPGVVKDFQARASKTLSARSVNKHVTVLGTLLNWAVENQLVRINPIKSIRMLPARAVREQRALTDEEIAELLDTCSDESREVWLLFLHTGLRKKEMANLTWEDIDFERGEILIRPEVAKSKKSRRIPMTEEVRVILERRRGVARDAPADGIVLPTIEGRGFYDYVLRAFDRDIDAASIDKTGVHIHALRRTFATRLIRLGVDPKSVQTLLGHSTLDLTLKLYTDAKAMDLKSAVDKLKNLEVREPLPAFRVVA